MKFYDVWGTDQTYNHMAVGWTWAFDTPFCGSSRSRRTLGAPISMVVSWPAKIKDKGGLASNSST